MEETETVAEHDDLWVDKYAPRSFTELLSDEQTNREVLTSRFSKQVLLCMQTFKKGYISSLLQCCHLLSSMGKYCSIKFL